MKDARVVITGGAQGIGFSAAEKFYVSGSRVFILDIDRDAGERSAQTLSNKQGGEITFMHCDVSSADNVSQVLEKIFAAENTIDVIYNNASVFLSGKDGIITDIHQDIWERVVSVNLSSVYYMCRFGIPLMIRSGGGSVINTSSSAGLIGIPGCDAYTATKGAVIALTRSMAVEYRPKGIRVNCIAPAGIVTPMLKQSNTEDSTFDEQRFLNLRTPSRRYGTPEEIASVAYFLASPESSYINGAVITADGGITINGDLSKLLEEQ